MKGIRHTDHKIEAFESYYYCLYSLADTVVISVCGPEANDGVGDCGSIDRGEAGYNGQDHSILYAVVA